MSKIDEGFDLQAYVTKGVENVVSDALRATFKDPRETAFMLKFAAASKAASKKRREAEECLEQAAMKALKASGKTFAACESCTGGDIARRFTELPGASAFFLGGAVTYVNAVKTELAGVPETLLEEKTAVSLEVAAAMAEGIRARLGADLAVSVTGLAGPDGDGVHEVGTVFIALAAEGQTFVRETRMGAFRTRSFIRRMAGNHAFDMIRRYLGGLQVE